MPVFGVTSSEDEAVVPTRPVPRRQRDLSPVNVRYGTSQVKGPDGKHTRTQLCLIRGCPYPARVLQNFRFCSHTCGRLVSLSFWLDALHLPNPLNVLGLQPIRGGVFRTDRTPIAEGTCENIGLRQCKSRVGGSQILQHRVRLLMLKLMVAFLPPSDISHCWWCPSDMSNCWWCFHA